MTYGAVYIARNEEDPPKLYKLGKTTKQVEKRMKELTSETSNIGEYKEVGYVVVSDVDSVEKETHKRLQAYRYQENREFFKCSLDELISTLRSVSDKYLVKDELPNLDNGDILDVQKLFKDDKSSQASSNLKCVENTEETLVAVLDLQKKSHSFAINLAKNLKKVESDSDNNEDRLIIVNSYQKKVNDWQETIKSLKGKDEKTLRKIYSGIVYEFDFALIKVRFQRKVQLSFFTSIYKRALATSLTIKELGCGKDEVIEIAELVEKIKEIIPINSSDSLKKYKSLLENKINLEIKEPEDYETAYREKIIIEPQDKQIDIDISGINKKGFETYFNNYKKIEGKPIENNYGIIVGEKVYSKEDNGIANQPRLVPYFEVDVNLFFKPFVDKYNNVFLKPVIRIIPCKLDLNRNKQILQETSYPFSIKAELIEITTFISETLVNALCETSDVNEAFKAVTKFILDNKSLINNERGETILADIKCDAEAGNFSANIMSSNIPDQGFDYSAFVPLCDDAQELDDFFNLDMPPTG